MDEFTRPLYDPSMDVPGPPLPLDRVVERAREVLAETAGANIHNPAEMLRASTSLHMRLRRLVAAIEATQAR
ncbi:hypothetical protein GCM10010275_30270 [Streptomyces litmocidini]|uniref:hypothetical protein n=1 Tax=Streptomyces litmocidini TaxID=67318 RepID=UPI00167D4BCE|nr:hypothetical protein [Streptomyces litmocidini]GGU91133.1 hypothetical protein GCM10010275_30270 [Streptomyces litmocidini]